MEEKYNKRLLENFQRIEVENMENKTFDRSNEKDSKQLKNIMDMLGGQYRKKPVVIRAFRNEARPINIQTLEGIMTANIGDWVIEGVNGEFYPCKPDVFEKTYEEVQEAKRKASLPPKPKDDGLSEANP